MARPGDSSIQREVELVILGAISMQLGADLEKHRVNLPGGTWVEVDGVNDEFTVFAEAFAHIGPMKGGQKRKVALDVLKLVTLQRTHPNARLVLAFCDDAARDSLTGWLDEAITTFGVDRMVAPLDSELRQRLIEAQASQYR